MGASTASQLAGDLSLSGPDMHGVSTAAVPAKEVVALVTDHLDLALLNEGLET
jgi:hypothetical protein